MLESATRRAHRLPVDWFGVALICLGAVVLAGWWLRVPAIVQVPASSSPMQPWTAASFALTGTALVLLQRGASRSVRVARTLLGLVGAISLAMLAEYLGRDLGIDRLLGSPFVVAHTRYPGRMAPNTAVCFVALAASYGLLSGPRDMRRAVAAAILASVAGAIAGTALIGYFTGLERSYGWGAYTRMAVTTAAGLCATSTMAMRLARRAAQRAPRAATGWAPWLALLTGAVMTVFAARAVSVPAGPSPGGTVWLVLASGGLISALWALAVRRGDVLSERSEALEAALRDLRQSHEEIELQRADLARSHGLIDAVLTGTTDAVFAKDLGGRYLFINESGARLLGRARTEVVGACDQDLVPFATAAVFWQADLAVLAASATQTGEETGVIEGRSRTFLATKGVLRDQDGRPFGTFGISRDISERKEREAALAASEVEARRLTAELERSNQDLERFAYVASHDLREPLRTVTSFAQLLQRRYAERLDATGREFLDFVSDGARRMDRMIVGLLALSRVERKGGPMELVPLDEPLADALANLRLPIEESAAVVVTGELPIVVVDRGQMTMLFQNLVGNSLKYRRQDTAPHIEIAARDLDGEWEISVADDGPGIPRQHLQHVFQLFFRVDPRGQTPGTGTGLTLCRRIAERHGGRIWAEARAERGSVFFFTLPRGPGALGARQAKAV